jgi:hypothetical protein
MTATPAATDRFAGFRKAGAKFGIDLAGLFDDDSEEGASAFEGLAPSFKVTSQLKGRSPSTATFKQPSAPARTTEFKLAPELTSAVTAPSQHLRSNSMVTWAAQTSPRSVTKVSV